VHWEDDELRRRGLISIEIFERDIENGQQQLFLNRSDFGEDVGDHRLFDALGEAAQT
jgi:hypothetical protein